MKITQLRDKTREELLSLIEDWRAELFQRRARMKKDQVEKSSRFAELRRDIARALTVINEQRRHNVVDKEGA